MAISTAVKEFDLLSNREIEKKYPVLVNESGLIPRGVAVLVRAYIKREKDSVIEIPEEAQKRVNMVDTQARVIAIGESAWHDEPHPRAKVGDLVLVTKFAGFVAVGPKDKGIYRIVNDRDIFCQLLEEEEEVV